MLVADFLNEAWQPGKRADFSVVGCDEYIEMKLSVVFTSRGRVGGYLSTCPCRKREQNTEAIIVHRHSLDIEVRILTALAHLSF